MPSVRLTRVDFCFGPCDIFNNLNLVFSAGWTGIVGSNGAGKTTLLHLVAGALSPDAGTVDCEGMVVHYCPQKIVAPGAPTLRFAHSWDRHAIRLRAELKLETDDLERWSSLSPGERKRWQIGAALFADPDVLLLDEPTNHLDAEARDRLAASLRRYRGVGLLVSHDRHLLDALCEQMIFLQQTVARSYRGHYSAAKRQRDQEAAGTTQEHLRLRNAEKSAMRRLARTREKRAQAQRSLSSKHRMKGPRDSDARSAAAKARAQNGEARLSRSVTLSRNAADGAREARKGLRIQKTCGRSLFVDYKPAPMDPILTMERRDVRSGDRMLLADVTLHLRRNARVRLSGANGTGKTTLLRTLMSTAGHRADRLVYLPQEIPPTPWRELSPGCCNLLAALGVDPARLRASDAPSPGELRKLALAQGLAKGAWALLLDEPTNHLDLPSIDRLQRALADYPGALILVSHDDVLADALTTERWHIEGGELGITTR